MAWQDIAITISIFALNYALVPQIILAQKRKKSLISIQTATITTIGMTALAITYLALGLTFSAAMAFISAILWATILIQSIIHPKN